MSNPQSRRQFITLLAAAPLLTLPACTGMGGFSMTDAVRELLMLSSENALAKLTAPGGFYDNQVARITLPNQVGNQGNILTRLLTSNLAKDRLTREMNRAAERGAERAAPIIVDVIRNISITDALYILRGGPTAATALLQQNMGDSLIGAMFPELQDALSIAGNPVVAELLRSTSGVDINSLAQDASRQANAAIFRAIGQEESAIRANPQQTRNPLLIGALSLGR